MDRGEKGKKTSERVVALVLLPPLVCAYAFALHWVYSTLVSPQYSYLGYRYSAPTELSAVVSVLMAIVVSLALPRRLNRASSIMLWILYTVTVAPSILLAPYTSYLDEATAIQVGITVGVTFIIVSLSQSTDPKPLQFSVSPTSLWLVLALVSSVTYALLFFTQGLSFSFLSILDVYDVRADFADEVRQVGILSYLVATQANVVNPLIAALGVQRRNLLLIATAVGGQLVLYATTGFKHVLFAVLAWVIMLVLLRRKKATGPRGASILVGAVGVIVISAIVDVIMSTNLATSLFSRRFILTPGVFTSAYVRYFSDNPQAHLGYSVLAPFVDYPYQTTPPYLIGAWIANDPEMSSNANLFADGFANFGWLGIVGAGAVLLIYLRVIDRASAGLPMTLVGLVTVIPSVSLSNSSILTSMLSHGLVAAVVLLALLPRPTPDHASEGSADLPPAVEPRPSWRTTRRSPYPQSAT